MKSLSREPPITGGALLALLIVACASAGALARAQVPSQPPGSQALADTPEVHLARGHEDLNNHRYEAAEREFRAALALDPHLTVRARFPLAVVLFALQQHDEARQQFEAVLKKTGDDPNVNYYLGRLDLMDGNLDAAIHNLTIAVSKPPFPDAPYYLGYAYFRKKDFNSAEKWLKQAAGLAPHDARVRERLGLLYRAMGRQQDAQKAFAAATELHQQDIVANQQALDCGHSLDTQPLEQARNVCQKLLDPEDLGKLVSLGTLYGQHRDYTDAVEPFRLAVEIDPDSYEMQYNLGLTYFRLKRYGEALGPLRKAVALRPDIFEVNAPLGAALYALGDDAAAYPVLDHANRLKPENGDISGLLFKAALDLAQKNFEEHNAARAREYLLRAAEARPEDPEPHRRLAQLYQSLGDRANAQHERNLGDKLSSH
ncbi:MAG: tetratricopeptide repeat protein [Terriglobia bacterium]